MRVEHNECGRPLGVSPELGGCACSRPGLAELAERLQIASGRRGGKTVVLAEMLDGYARQVAMEIALETFYGTGALIAAAGSAGSAELARIDLAIARRNVMETYFPDLRPPENLARKLRVLNRVCARGDLVRALRRQGAWS